MIFKMVLYVLKSSGAAIRAKLAGVIHYIGYTPSKADPDVWLRPEVNTDGSDYYEILLCYVDDVLAISNVPMRTMDGIRSVFKRKDKKADVPDV